MACDTIGFQNSNPGNLTTGHGRWKSAVGVDAFHHLKFADDRAGLEAIKACLRTYKRHYKISTIERLCGRWVNIHDSDKNKASWVRAVRKRTGTKAGAKLDFTDPPEAERIAKGIVYAENSCDSIPESIYQEVFGEHKNKQAP